MSWFEFWILHLLAEMNVESSPTLVADSRVLGFNQGALGNLGSNSCDNGTEIIINILRSGTYCSMNAKLFARRKSKATTPVQLVSRSLEIVQWSCNLQNLCKYDTVEMRTPVWDSVVEPRGIILDLASLVCVGKWEISIFEPRFDFTKISTIVLKLSQTP